MNAPTAKPHPVDHWRGFTSMARTAAAPLGRFVCRRLDELRTPERLERGLVLVLPGMESESTVNHGIARGLAGGGVEQAIELFDWTTGWPGLCLFHLRGRSLHRRQVKRLLDRIGVYQEEFPGRPVHLVGHSAGAAMTVLTLEQMAGARSITGGILLAAAVSPNRDLCAALTHTERGIWNFYSPFDLVFLGMGTMLFGTLDGQHGIAAGACGFQQPAELDEAGRLLYREKLHEVPYKLPMSRSWNLGGHMGATNQEFVAAHLAPIINGEQQPGLQSR